MRARTPRNHETNCSAVHSLGIIECLLARSTKLSKNNFLKLPHLTMREARCQGAQPLARFLINLMRFLCIRFAGPPPIIGHEECQKSGPRAALRQLTGTVQGYINTSQMDGLRFCVPVRLDDSCAQRTVCESGVPNGNNLRKAAAEQRDWAQAAEDCRRAAGRTTDPATRRELQWKLQGAEGRR